MPAADTIAMVDAAILKQILRRIDDKMDNWQCTRTHAYSHPTVPKSTAPMMIPIDDECPSSVSSSLGSSPPVFDISGSERPPIGEEAIDFAARSRPIDMADCNS